VYIKRRLTREIAAEVIPTMVSATPALCEAASINGCIDADNVLRVVIKASFPRLDHSWQQFLSLLGPFL